MGGRADGPHWRLIIDDVGRSGDYNMAVDEELLGKALRRGAHFLRLYRWDPPTLSLGRNQRPVRNDVPVVRRPTGGQAVWHEHEVTYAVAAPIETFGSLRTAYCEIHTRLAEGLRSLGVDAALAPARRPGASGSPGSCFAVPVGGEILAGGRKLVGSAQVRRAGAFLQHGSILLDGSQAIVSAVRGETTLAEVLARPVSFGEVAAAVIGAWGEPLEETARRPVRPSAPPDIASPALR